MIKRDESGAIVIEATLALSTFMFFIVIILSITNICLAQAKIGTLTHGIAKDISRYTYVYTMTGLNNTVKSNASNAAYADESIEKVISDSGQVFDVVEDISNLASDTEFWNSMSSLLIQAAYEKVSSEMINGVCKSLTKKRLALSGIDADTYLRRLGVVDGLEGLSFNSSEFCSGGGDDIKIIATYQLHLLRFFKIDMNFNIKQCAYTKSWCAIVPSVDRSLINDSKGDGNADKPEGNQDNEDESTLETETETETEAETETAEHKKTTSEYVYDATHNPDSDSVMLGKYNPNDNSDNYVFLAEQYNMTYFSLSTDDWTELDNESPAAVWEVNKAFLEKMEGEGKTFYFSSDPYEATGYFANEVAWLMDQGYSFEVIPGTDPVLYKAVRP